ncbi:MAG: ATPase domain-containing protein [Nitrosopumilus sp.]
MTGSTKETSYISTGIPGLDELLEGRGFPSGHLVFMLGSPGSGKTTAAFQFLTYGCEIGEKGVYVTLDETPEDLVKNMKRFRLDIDNYVNEKKLSIVDATPIRRFPGKVQLGAISIGKRDFSLASLIGAIQTHIKELGAKRLVIDPITSFLLQFLYLHPN